MTDELYQQDHEQTHLEEVSVIVIMVPFPAQSHLNQLLQLSFLISSYKIPVHYVSSTIHNRQVRLRDHGFHHNHSYPIQFHDFSIPPFLSPSPNPNPSSKFPDHLQPSFDACLHLRQPIAELLHTLSVKARRIVIIHDFIMVSTILDAAAIPNAEAYCFQSTCAFTFFHNLWEGRGKPFPVEDNIQDRLPSLDGCFCPEFIDYVTRQFHFLDLPVGELHNTSRLIDGSYIDLLAKFDIDKEKKRWAIGPLNPVKINDHRNRNTSNKYLEWLDTQEPNSVLYVSFGTTTTMSDEQIKELAIGLEKSETKFIWVLREADIGNIFAKVSRSEVLEGFEKRIKGMGIVVREWAPQLEILGHPSTGGFMSHCGWNSCMESITMGVPIAAWPMHSDQPRNSVLVTEVLEIGLLVKEWTSKEEIVTSSAIEESVTRLMASEEGNAMRKKAQILGEAVRESAAQGISRTELESFVSHIAR